MSLLRSSKSFVIVIAISLLVKFVAIFKDRMVGATFGLSADLDIFYFTLTFISIPSSIFLNSVQTAIVPFIISNFKTSQFSGQIISNIFHKVIKIYILLLSAWLILGFLVALLMGVSDGTIGTHSYWIIINLPHVFLSGWILIQHGVLQADGYSKIVSLLPAILSIVIIVILEFSSDVGVESLVYGYTIAVIVEFCIAKRLICFGHLPTLSFDESKLEEFWREVRRLCSVFFFLATVPLVDSLIALTLDSGDLVALTFGGKIPLAINSLILIGINTVLFPAFSKYGLTKSRTWMKAMYLKYAVGLAVTLMLLVIFGLWFGVLLIKIIFYSGNFDQFAVNRVASVQAMYFWTMPFAAVSTLGIKFLVSVNKSQTVANVTKITVPFNMFVSYFAAVHMGPSGIALGTAATFCLSSILMGYSVLTVEND